MTNSPSDNPKDNSSKEATREATKENFKQRDYSSSQRRNSHSRPRNDQHRSAPNQGNRQGHRTPPNPQNQNQNQNNQQNAQSFHRGPKQHHQPSPQGRGQRPNHNGPHNPNRSRRPRPQRPYNRQPSAQYASEKRPYHLDRAYEKYLNLLDQHLIQRRKYFELFFRADPQQKIKLEKNFYQSLYDLREFERTSTEDVKEYLLFKTNGKKEDGIYSENHQLAPMVSEDLPTPEDIRDPHLLPSQKKQTFKEDQEESIGTLDDYMSYKGMS